MNENVRQIQADIDERIRGVVVRDVYSHATVSAPFSVQHSLGVIPSMVVAMKGTNANVWSEPEDERVWSATKVVLRCDVASAPLKLLVIE